MPAHPGNQGLPTGGVTPPNAGCWVFDVDGCLVDSLTGMSLRPGAREILEHLAGRTRVYLWSAGGDDYARDRAGQFGVDHLVSGYFSKETRDADGCYLTTHLPVSRGAAVFVDDRPEDLAAPLDVLAVSPYLGGGPARPGPRAVARTGPGCQRDRRGVIEDTVLRPRLSAGRSPASRSELVGRGPTLCGAGVDGGAGGTPCQAIRRRPMRRGRATVPARAGDEAEADLRQGDLRILSAAMTVSVKARSSSDPAGPHARAVDIGHRVLSEVARAPASTLRSRRMRCAVAGSDLLPNSSRSPCRRRRPGLRRQASSTRATPGSAAARVSASTSSSRYISASSALETLRTG